MSAEDPKDDSKPHALAGRRALVMAGACAVAAAAAVPAAAFVAAPLGAAGARGRWVRTLKLDQLRESEPKRVAIVSDRRDAWTLERNVELGSVWLVRKGEAVTAFSAVCPHLGCSVNVAPAGFACPCHTSAFAADGKRQSGPSPRDLDVLATRLEDGYVAVDFRRFRIGVSERTEA
jgi:menaquinol-cytochrome c reductase iron-sulfur subunit